MLTWEEAGLSQSVLIVKCSDMHVKNRDLVLVEQRLVLKNVLTLRKNQILKGKGGHYHAGRSVR